LLIGHPRLPFVLGPEIPPDAGAIVIPARFEFEPPMKVAPPPKAIDGGATVCPTAWSC
jgi:hypothetical protein